MSKRSRAEAKLASELNSLADQIAPWMQEGAIIHITSAKPKFVPDGSPAWYDPRKGDIFVCIEDVFPGEDPEDMLSYVHAAMEVARRTPTLLDLSRVSSEFDPDKVSKAGAFSSEVRKGLTIIGMIQHEAAHSRWSLWLSRLFNPSVLRSSKITNAEMSVLILLEELRIEGRAVTARDDGGGEWTANPTDPNKDSTAFGVSALRAEFAWLLRSGIKDQIQSSKELGASTTTAANIAGIWTLSYGRFLAGVAAETDVQPIHELLETSIGKVDLDRLIDVVNRAVTIYTVPYVAKKKRRAIDYERATAELVSCAREWLEIVGVPPEAFVLEGATAPAPDGSAGEGDKEATAAKGSGEEDGEGEGKGKGKGKEKEDGEGEGTQPGPSDSGANGEESPPSSLEDWHMSHGYGSGSATGDEELLAEANELLERAIDEMAADFSAPVPEEPRPLADSYKTILEALGPDGKARGARLFTDEEPSPAVRALATKAGQRLEMIQAPAITRESTSSYLPPGRLRSRDAVRAAADRSRGVATKARPWTATRRRHDLVRPTTIGIMTDVSGSMGWAERIAAEYIYVFGLAGTRVSATTMGVVFGASVEVSLPPHETAKKVRVRPARDGHESFNEAAAAMEGGLHLTTNTDHVRIVFVLSDGHFVQSGQPEACRQWIRQWTATGVYVVWVGAGHGCAVGEAEFGKNPRLSISSSPKDLNTMVDETLAMAGKLVHSATI